MKVENGFTTDNKIDILTEATQHFHLTDDDRHSLEEERKRETERETGREGETGERER